MMLSPRREHHFWRLGADLESPRNDQNEPKVLSERCKKSDAWQLCFFHEKCDNMTNTDPHETVYILCEIDVFNILHWIIYWNLRAKKWGILRYGTDFWSSKRRPKWWLFRKMRKWVSTGKNNGLLHIGHPRMSKKRELKSMIFQ